MEVIDRAEALKPDTERVAQGGQMTSSIKMVRRGCCDSFRARLHRSIKVGHVAESGAPVVQILTEMNQHVGPVRVRDRCYTNGLLDGHNSAVEVISVSQPFESGTQADGQILQVAKLLKPATARITQSVQYGG